MQNTDNQNGSAVTEPPKDNIKKQFNRLPKKDKKVAASMGVVALMIFSFIGYSVFASKSEEPKPLVNSIETKVEKTNELRKTTEDEDQTSDEYKQMLKQTEAERLKENKTDGASYVKDPSALSWSNVEKPKPVQVEAPKVNTNAYAITPEKLAKLEAEKLQAMAVYYSSVSGVNEGGGSVVVRGTYKAPVATSNSDSNLQNGAQGSLIASNVTDSYYPTSRKTSALATETVQPGFVPGDVLMAASKYAVDSDTTTQIIAQIISGPLAGAEVPLNVKRVGEYVVFETINISWNRFASPFTAIAIDPGDVASNNFSTWTDRHILFRYGSLFVSSFAEGAGELAQKATSSVSVSGETVTTTSDVDTSDYVVAGVGKIGSRMASIAEKNFETPPTVHVNKGQEMALVVIQPAEIPWLPEPYRLKTATNIDSANSNQVAASTDNVAGQNRVQSAISTPTTSKTQYSRSAK